MEILLIILLIVLFVVLDIDWWIIAIMAVGIAAYSVFELLAVVRTQYRKQPTGQERLIGMVAKVKSVLNPKGTVFVHGELWEAILDEGRAEPGEEVAITEVRGLKLRVTKNK